MKIVVIGGSGRIGKALVHKLRELGHEVVEASPSSRVIPATGEGLREALDDAQMVIDVTNSPSFDDEAVLRFFEIPEGNCPATESGAVVRHHAALSVGRNQQVDSAFQLSYVEWSRLRQAVAGLAGPVRHQRDSIDARVYGTTLH